MSSTTVQAEAPEYIPSVTTPCESLPPGEMRRPRQQRFSSERRQNTHRQSGSLGGVLEIVFRAPRAVLV